MCLALNSKSCLNFPGAGIYSRVPSGLVMSLFWLTSLLCWARPQERDHQHESWESVSQLSLTCVHSLYRAVKPPGGESSNLFGSPEEGIPSSKPNRMASNIFGPTEEPKNIPKRTNPPGMVFVPLPWLPCLRSLLFFLKYCLRAIIA